MPSAKEVQRFRRRVRALYNSSGRHVLPWRRVRSPYRILVSEIMLQQTQVARVIPKYRAFLREFPTVHSLARAPLARVLALWSGLGYNRRAKSLHDAAKAIVEKHGGKVPRSYRELIALPGVGEYTAKAVRIFAWNEPEVLVETNIRTAFLHHFYQGRSLVKDGDILAVAADAAMEQSPREWHWALMDYGAYLKASGVRLNARSAHYTKQSKFEGSLRQIRGAILRALHGGGARETHIYVLIRANKHIDRIKCRQALAGLERDGLLRRRGRAWNVA